MRWPDARPIRMTRVAIVAPEDSLRPVLVLTADAGVVELDVPVGAGRTNGSAPVAGPGGAEPRLSLEAPDPEECRRTGRLDLLSGEAQLARHLSGAVHGQQVAAVRGWVPEASREQLAARVAARGGSAVPLPRPRGIDPPTRLAGRGLSDAFTPLVQTYGTVPYADVDPTLLAGLAYVVMFGIMFADAGHGALLLVAGLLLWRGRPRWIARWRRGWPFVAGAGLTSMVFGLLYGEFFGPTGALPTLWLKPLDHPVPLLVSGVAVGAVLLAGAYAVGVVNRRREGGWGLALYAPSGVAGSALFLALGMLIAGGYLHVSGLLVAGGVLAGAALVLAFVGFVVAAGGGGAGITQAAVELFDLVIRLASNLVSFARLAAFGLTHAALGYLVWRGTSNLWRSGGGWLVVAVVLFIAGNALAFGLEALVAGIQALRLEYYELFSRVFDGEGRPFRPWHIPLATDGAAAGPPPRELT